MLDDAPPAVEIERPAADTIIGANEDGTFWATAPPGSTWTKLGAGPAEVERFTGLGATLVDWDLYPEQPDFVVRADSRAISSASLTPGPPDA